MMIISILGSRVKGRVHISQYWISIYSNFRIYQLNCSDLTSKIVKLALAEFLLII
jgi:hypothetical protein